MGNGGGSEGVRGVDIFPEGLLRQRPVILHDPVPVYWLR